MSPRSVSQNEALREESRARIIAAALELFSSGGYERTTVRMIAERAGVAQGLMYSHFGGKEELLRAIFAQSIEDVGASFRLAEAEAGGAPTPAAIIRAAFVLVRQRLAFWRLSYGVRMQPGVLAILGDDLLAWINEIRSTLERAFSAMGYSDAALRAEILFATIDGVAQHYVIDPQHYPLEAIVELLVIQYQQP
jgi:AcrR family transcriptional regulator